MSLAKNSFILFLSEGGSSVLTLITGLLIARRLELADYGRFNAALAFASILAIIVDSGMGMVAAKDIAQGTPRRLEQLEEIFTWRFIIIVVACAVGPFIAKYFVRGGAVASTLALWIVPGVLLIGMTDFFAWVFKGLQLPKRVAAIQVGTALLLFILCVAALWSSRPLTLLLVAWNATGLVMTLGGLYLLAFSLRVLRWSKLPREFFRDALPGIYKLGLILILSVAFTRVDLLMVARMRGAVETGLFSASGRIIDGLRLIPMAAYGVFLPAFSAARAQSRSLRPIFGRGMVALIAMAVSIAIVGTQFAHPIFLIVLGQKYVSAIPCFKPLLWSCVFMFPNILMFALLYSRNDHRTPLIAICAAITLEISLNALWLPRYGVTGASWARFSAEALNASIMASRVRGALL